MTTMDIINLVISILVVVSGSVYFGFILKDILLQVFGCYTCNKIKFKFKFKGIYLYISAVPVINARFCTKCADLGRVHKVGTFDNYVCISVFDLSGDEVNVVNEEIIVVDPVTSVIRKLKHMQLDTTNTGPITVSPNSRNRIISLALKNMVAREILKDNNTINTSSGSDNVIKFPGK